MSEGLVLAIVLAFVVLIFGLFYDRKNRRRQSSGSDGRYMGVASRTTPVAGSAEAATPAVETVAAEAIDSFGSGPVH